MRALCFALLLALAGLAQAQATNQDAAAQALVELVAQDRALDRQDGGVALALRRYVIRALLDQISAQPSSDPVPEFAPIQIEAGSRLPPLSQVPQSMFDVGAERGTGQGWIFVPRLGEPILASGDGLVVALEGFEWRPQILLLRHADGTYSVYQGGFQALVGVGAEVTSGQIIATAAQVRGEQVLEWQIRQSGRVLDPALWLSRD